MRWVQNTDFDNAVNWKTGKVPCRNERVRFPGSVTSVFVQHNSTVLEIVSTIQENVNKRLSIVDKQKKTRNFNIVNTTLYRAIRSK